MTTPPGGVRVEHGGTAIYVYRDGRIWGVNSARFLKGSTHSGGYKTVTLGALSGDPKQLYFHDLVLTNFSGPRPPGMVARHRDGDPAHNHLDNLVWGTPKENVEDEFDHGTAPLLAGTHNRAKLSPTQVRSIKRQCDAGCFGHEIEIIAEAHGVTVRTIENVLSGKTWKRLNF
ncbi:hypothetical protein ADL19_14975 [Streptomyces purpurogeneiscleroticus]|nr:hypothetical protein ADL19_14975 [Streptomyces purpurogeneiscleroticus]